MNKGLRIFGHPLHVMVVDFPIVLWCAAPLCDALWLWRSDMLWVQMSFWSLLAGLAASVVAVVAGLIDFQAIPGDSVAKSVAERHMITMSATASIMIFGFIVQGTPMTVTPVRMISALVILSIGLLVMGYGLWLGGELVLRHGIGRTDS